MSIKEKVALFCERFGFDDEDRDVFELFAREIERVTQERAAVRDCDGGGRSGRELQGHARLLDEDHPVRPGDFEAMSEPKTLDCGNNPCLFATDMSGMRTQGGCRCMDRIGEILGIRIRTMPRIELERVLRATIDAHREHALAGSRDLDR